jgi:cytosine/uracil/thiamine/allantoin permease
MRLGAILNALAGLVLAAWLLFLNFDEVLTVLASAGADLTIVITFYGVQITLCGGVEGL